MRTIRQDCKPRGKAAFLRAALVVGMMSGCAKQDLQPLPYWRLIASGQREGMNVELPVHLDDRLPNFRSEYKIRLTTTPRASFIGEDLNLVFPGLQALASLKVNGQPAVPIHRFAKQHYRNTGLQAWFISARSDERLDLEMTVSHTWTKSAWLDGCPLYKGRIKQTLSRI